MPCRAVSCHAVQLGCVYAAASRVGTEALHLAATQRPALAAAHSAAQPCFLVLMKKANCLRKGADGTGTGTGTAELQRFYA